MASAGCAASDGKTSDRAVLVPTDPRMDVPGRPQSASGQAAILTGKNIPMLIGEHYGPRPNAPIREILAQDNFFKQVVAHGMTAALLEAYPPRFHAVLAERQAAAVQLSASGAECRAVAVHRKRHLQR